MRDKTPVVWVLEGSKLGDNAQVRGLAARLPGHIEFKTLRYNRMCRLPNYLLGAGLASVVQGGENLVEPWPNIVIGIGRRSVPVARWIRRQSNGHTRLVQLGRPRAHSGIFDLVITTPQYGLLPALNVVELALPFASDLTESEAEMDFWRREFSSLRRPIIAVLVGGPRWPHRMRRLETRDLTKQAEELRQRLGGTLIFIDSPRTPRNVFEEGLKPTGDQFRHFRWDAGKRNPYRSVLEIADRFIVTSDSVSMLAEALRTSKPVDVYRLPIHRVPRLPLQYWPFPVLVRRGFLASRRDVEVLLSTLIANNHVGILGGRDISRAPVPREEESVVRRVTDLLERRDEVRIIETVSKRRWLPIPVVRHQ